MAPEIGTKSVGTFEKQAPVLLKNEKMDASVSSISITKKFFLLRNSNVYIFLAYYSTVYRS